MAVKYKIVIGILVFCAVALSSWFGWHEFNRRMLDKVNEVKATMERAAVIEKEISLIDTPITRKYAEQEINQANSFLKEAKETVKRNEFVKANALLKQAETAVKTAQEKDISGRQADYDASLVEGRNKAAEGLWDEAIRSFDMALQYKPGDIVAERAKADVIKSKVQKILEQEIQKIYTNRTEKVRGSDYGVIVHEFSDPKVENIDIQIENGKSVAYVIGKVNERHQFITKWKKSRKWYKDGAWPFLCKFREDENGRWKIEDDTRESLLAADKILKSSNSEEKNNKDTTLDDLTLDVDLGWYDKTVDKRSLSKNDKLYILLKMKAKYEKAGVNVSKIGKKIETLK